MRSPMADATPPPLLPELALASQPLFPPLILAIYIACIAGAGALANFALLAALLRRSRNGLFLIIIQLAVADFILLGTSVGPELWSNNTRTWIFGRSGCIIYRGLNIFTSTASLYLTITIALHTLSTANLETKATVQTRKNEGDDDEEIRSSRYSLVTNDTSTPPRTMNVDYRLADTRVPVAPPSLFVWILAISLSIPEFALATTVRHEHDIIACTLIDTSHRINMHSMIALFNLFLPALLLTSAGAVIVFRLKSKRLFKLKGSETIPALKLSICLIFVYIIFCAPRSVFYIYGLYSFSDVSKLDLGYGNDTILMINLVFGAMYLAAALVRPLLCISLLPRLRKIFSFGFRSVDEV